MTSPTNKIHLIHFNDVYNIEPRSVEPVGGAARFITAVSSFSKYNPMVLFSGDVFAPSLMSATTKGEQMVPVLNALNVRCAVYGNHDFDFGIDTLLERVEKTKFPWLLSNVVDNETGRPLAEGKIFHIEEWCGRKIGLIGLVEKEWLVTLSTINPEEVTFTDYVTAASELSRELRQKGCEFIIALTHMRSRNDIRLAENVSSIDLILGGHDHVNEKTKVNGTYIVKSGTDFRQFSLLTIEFTEGRSSVTDILSLDVTSEYENNVEMSTILNKYIDKMDVELCKELGEFECDLNGLFPSIRTEETNLGNFLTDIMVSSTNAHFAILNAGTLRSDMIHPAGPFFLKDLMLILPMIDTIVLLEVLGSQVLQVLENGVSLWPALEGRFPQVSGIRFAFDPSQKPGERIVSSSVFIGDEALDLNKFYRMATKNYIAEGKDGYDVLKDVKRLIDEENGPQLIYAVQNHFKALSIREGKTPVSTVHHQSLVTLSRKASLVSQLTNDGRDHLPAHMPENFVALGRPSTIGDLEAYRLNPIVENRIIRISPNNDSANQMNSFSL